MRSKLFAAICASLLLAAPGIRGQQQFSLFTSVVDSNGAAVTKLEPGDLRVTENDQEAKVVKVEPINWPTKVQLLVDNGTGMGSENLVQLRNGLKALFEALPANLEVTFVTTAPQPRFLVRPTTDKAAMIQGIDRLAPDSGAGRFVESLNEATQRIEKDKTDYFPVIISIATTAGDANVMERDIERLMKRLQARPTTVHVVLLSGGGRTGTGGANQTQVGIAVTQMTRGRFENIAAGSRLQTLLPEIGAQVAKAHERQSNQFRLTVERPAGAKGDLGKISMGARGGLRPTGVSTDGLHP